MTKLRCSCGYIWNYGGNKKRACCPSCGNKVTVDTHRQDKHRRVGSRGPLQKDEQLERMKFNLEYFIKAHEEALKTISGLRHDIEQLKRRKNTAASNRGSTIEARLLEEIMKTPMGTDEHVNRQLEAAQHVIKEMRRKRVKNNH